MSLEWRKVKAFVLVALLFGAEAQKVHQEVRLNAPKTKSVGSTKSSSSMGFERGLEAMMVDRNIQKYAQRIAQQMEAMMAQPAGSNLQEQAETFAKEIQRVMADPNWRKQEQRFTAETEEIMSDLTFQKHTNRVTEKVNEMKADPHFEEQGKLIKEQLENMMNAKSHEQTQFVAEQIEALMADPAIQEKEKAIHEQLDAMMTDPSVKQRVQAVTKGMDGVMKNMNSESHSTRAAEQTEMKADSVFQKQSEFLTEQMEKLMANPNSPEMAKAAIESLMNDPTIQRQAKNAAEQMEALKGDSSMREEGEVFFERAKSFIADSKLHGLGQFFKERMEAMMTDPKLEKHVAHLVHLEKSLLEQNEDAPDVLKRIIEEMEAVEIDPHFREQTKLAAKEVKAMTTDPNFHKRVKQVGQSMEAMMTNPKLQEQAKLVAEPLIGMMGQQHSTANHMGGAQHSGDVLVDNLIDKMFDGAFKAVHEDDLNTMTVGKLGSLFASQVSPRLVAPFGLKFGRAPNLARHTPATQGSLFVRAEKEESKGSGLPPKKELKKMLPLASMFFCILFCYTVLRDTKDVLVVTSGGAEVIPFLKTYMNLPAAIGFTALYANMVNAMSNTNVFYTLIGGFMTFFASFATIIYPNRDLLHPVATMTNLQATLPVGFGPILTIIKYWTFGTFYTFAELWGSVVVSVLFWGFANEICSVSEAKTWYPLFGLIANVALIFSGQFIRYVSDVRSKLPAGVDAWGYSLNILMTAVVACAALVLGIYTYMQKKVLTDPEVMPANMQRKTKKKKPSMGLTESFKYLLSSSYIRNLAFLVISYGISINIVEVTWKSKLKAQFPDPNDYSKFMGAFSSTTGCVTLAMMIIGRWILTRFGWGVGALVTPVMLGATGVTFFSLILFKDFFAPLTAAIGVTPLMMAVLVGAAQNILSKASKYSLFDPCKETAYIPLDTEMRTKGKAAIDVIGNPLGKSGGAFIQQGALLVCGSLAASTPFLGAVLFSTVGLWIAASKNLAVEFEEKSAAMAKESEEK